jgi:uncharacterized SAM-binding protein YcdF (DUF218 family)
VANYLSVQLEYQYPAYLNQPSSYIVVLGSGHNDLSGVHIASALSSSGTKRVLTATNIHKANPRSQVIFTGFAGVGNKISNAQMNANFASFLGMNAQNMLVLGSEKDTADEANSVQKIVKNQSVILVTSAMHMPRAMRLFTSVGIKAIPAPADFQTNNIGFYSLPRIAYLSQSNQAIHEYLGLSLERLETWVKNNEK